VIVPAFTWISTANVVEFMGARPVFCDIDLRTFNIDPGMIEQAITPRTKAIIPVHLFGQCADMAAINEIAKRNKIRVIEIEDACQAIAAAQVGKAPGPVEQTANIGRFRAKAGVR
jgi:dTDP-4-amino-4,6-dideoxygalactose transaminase